MVNITEDGVEDTIPSLLQINNHPKELEINDAPVLSTGNNIITQDEIQLEEELKIKQLKNTQTIVVIKNI